MRYPTLALCLSFFSTGANAESRWTGGRSVCDAPIRAPLDSSLASPVDHTSLTQSWEYAVADADFVSGLKCYNDASIAAAGFADSLREIEAGVMPGLDATACSPMPASDLLARVREALARMKGAESFFASTLDRYESVSQRIDAANPAGLAFDDCRARAQRGWASARLSLNKLSCELSAAIDRLDGYRKRAEIAGVACKATPVANAAAAASLPLSN